jgi:hypothetical protein
MNEVACFCGCRFTFDGAAAACPTCGEVARVAPGPPLAGEFKEIEAEIETALAAVSW